MMDFSGLPDQDQPEAGGDLLSGLPDTNAGVLRKQYRTSFALPDEAAQINRLSDRTGLPGLVIARNKQKAEQIASEPDWDALETDAPNTVQALVANTKLFEIAHDDTENLSGIEKIIQTIKPYGSLLKQAAQKAPDTAGKGLNEAVLATNELLGIGGAQRALGLADPSGLLRENMRWYDERIKGIEKIQPQTTPQRYAGMIFDTLAQNMLTAPLGVAGKVPLLTGFAATAGGKLDDYLEAGYDPYTSSLLSLSNKAMEGLTEMIAVGKLYQGGKPLARRVLEFMGSDLLGEEINTTYSALVDKGTLRPDLTLGEFTQQLVDTAVVTIGAAGGQAAITQPFVALSSQYQEQKRKSELQRFFETEAKALHAEQTGQAFAQLSALSAANKVRARDPKAFQEFIETANQGAPVQDIYLDARTLQQAGIDLDALAATTPEMAERVREAVATGGDIVVPVSEYQAAIAGGELDAQLTPHLRTSEEGLSIDEAQRFYQTQAEEFQQAAAKVMEEKADDDAWTASAKVVEDTLLQQLRTAGRFTPDANTVYATLMRDFYATVAGRLGVTPEEAFARYPLRVSAERVEGGETRMEAPTAAQRLKQAVASVFGRGTEQTGTQQPALDMGQFFQASGGAAAQPTETPAFRTWAGTEAPVIEPEDIDGADFSGPGPFVMKVYHGTTHTFEEFNASLKGNIKGQFGAVNYFTSSYNDAKRNYAGEGPDLTNRIELKAERLADEITDFYENAGGGKKGAAALKKEYGKDVYDEDHLTMARNIVRKELHGGSENVMELYVKTEKPFVVGGDESPWIQFFDESEIEERAVLRVAEGEGLEVSDIEANRDDYQDQIDDARYEIMDEDGNPLIAAIQEVARRYEFDPSELLSSMYEITADGEVQHTELEKLLRENESLAYAERPEDGELVQSQMIGEIIQALGFDAIILKNADVRFKSMSMDHRTAHVHVFDANNTNIKSVDNTGAFDPTNPSIYKQPTETQGGNRGEITLADDITQQPTIISLLAKADLSTFLHEMGHFQLEVLSHIASQPDAPAQIAEDFDKVLQWFGITGSEEVGGGETAGVMGQGALSAIYSKLTAATVSFQGMKAQGVANFLTKQGVKKAEMEAVGLNEWLAAKKPTDKVTQAELGDFVKANTVELEDVVLGEESEAVNEGYWFVREGEVEAFTGQEPDGTNSIVVWADTEEEALALAAKYDKSPDSEDEWREDVYTDIDQIPGKVAVKTTHFSQYTEPGAVEGSYREMFVTAPGAAGEIDESVLNLYGPDSPVTKVTRTWQDGHPQYSEIKNPVVRIRFNEVNADGKRILRIEEMQGPNPDNQGKMPAHLKDNIYQLGVKRILAYAKENGFDGVALATKPGMSAGETQADRYSLEKHITKIEHSKSGIKEDHWFIRAFKGRKLLFEEVVATGKLDTLVGKDVAKKIVDGEGAATVSGTKELSGLDLKVGGEGLKQLYDNQIPKMLEAYGKGKMETVETLSPQDRSGERWVVLDSEDRVVRRGWSEDILRKELEPGQRVSYQEDKHSSMSYLPITQNTPARYPLFQGEDITRPNATNLPPGRTPLEVWRAMSLEEKRPYHEQFARGFEAYLFEGKAPSQELRPVFARLRAWLLRVYRSLANLKVEISDDLRGVFDRMLATDEAIREAEQLRKYGEMFTAPEGDQAAWEEMQQAGTEATQTATEELQRRSLRDMQWLSRARGRVLKQLQREAKAKRDAIEEEVTKEVREMPVYAAIRFLRYGVDIAGQQVPPVKLDLPALKEMYGEEPNALWRYLSTGRRGLAASKGIQPDAAAEMFGFTSGDQLVREILAAQPEASVVEGMTDQRMLERYGDIASQDGLERAADEAIHNEARARFLATQLKMLDKANTPARVIAKAAKSFAEAMIARKQIRAIKPRQHSAAEIRAAKAVEQAMRKGDVTAAATATRDQLVQNYSTRLSYEALTEIDKAVKYLRKFDKESVRKGLDMEYVDQIDQLLERFDLRASTPLSAAAKRTRLLAWVENQREQGFEPDIPEELLTEALRKPYRELTLEEMRGLVDTVKQIEHLGRLKQKLLTAKDQREFEAVRNTLAESIIANAKGVVDLRTRSNAGGALRELGKKYLAMHRKMASMARELDGFKDGGPMWEYFIRSMNTAGDKETSMRAEATRKLYELVKPLTKSGKMGGKGVFFPSIGMSLNREERIAIALNTGNESNMQRLLGGEGWTLAQLQPVLDTITPEEADFVQAVWDFFESYRPEIGEKEKRVYGKEPEWIAAQPVTLGGKTLRGGYYPVKYDPRRSGRAEQHADAEAAKQQMRGAYTTATTRRSFTKTRAEEVTGRPLLYSFAGIYQGASEVIHDLSWHEWLIDANRLLRALDGPIRTHYGAETVGVFKKAIEDIATGDAPPQNAFEVSVNHIRTGATIAGLGWNLMTSLLQPLGLTQSMVRVGPGWVAKGMTQWLKAPIQVAEDITNKSAFMRDRARTMQREINEIQNQIKGSELDPVRATFFVLIQKAQAVADIPTWLGAYEKAAADGNSDERAIALADQAVIDSQGGGQIKDLAQIQRGGPLLRLWTNFYSFFNVVYNLGVEKTKEKMHDPKLYPSLALDYLLLYILPSSLGVLMRQALTGGDDDDLAEKLIADQISYLFGLMIGLRELQLSAQKIAGVEQFKGGYGGPAGLRLFQEVDKLGTQIAQGEPDMALFKALDNVGGIMLHYPSGQVNRTVDGAAAMIEGRSENPMVLLTGPRR